MKSPYLDRLNREINAATNLTEKCCLRADRAGYLARFGDLETAKQEILELREINLTVKDGRVSISVGIADGLCKYYGGTDREAYESLKRARVLGIALGQRDLIAKAACWLALLEYGHQSFERMFDFMNESVQSNTEPEDPSTSARLALLVAQTLHLGNRFDLAISWYKAAHSYATNASDTVTISALMHNMASIWTTNTRNEVLGGMKTQDSGRTALAAAISTLNFDNLVGGTSFEYFTPLILAQLYSLEGKSAEAVRHYREKLHNIKLHDGCGWRAWMLSDFGWCLLSSGELDEGRYYINEARKTVRDDQHPDDLAATYKRLADSLFTIREIEIAESFAKMSEAKWREYSSMQQFQIDNASRFAKTNNNYFKSVIQANTN